MGISKTLAVPAIWALATLFAAGPVQAATRIINLTASVADTRNYFRTVGGVEYQQGELALDYNTFRPVKVVAGDTLEVQVSFDQPFTIPASASTTFFQLILLSYTYPSLGTGTSGITTSFFSNGSQVGAFGGGGTTTTGMLAAGTMLPGQQNGAITFDRLVTRFDVATLSTNRDTKNFEVAEGLFLFNIATVPAASAVPEPASWALMIAGFTCVGAGLRSRRGKASRQPGLQQRA